MNFTLRKLMFCCQYDPLKIRAHSVPWKRNALYVLLQVFMNDELVSFVLIREQQQWFVFVKILLFSNLY